MVRFSMMPWLAGGGGGSPPELPHATNTGETQSSAAKSVTDLGMTRLRAIVVGHRRRFTVPSHRSRRAGRRPSH